MIQTVDAAIDTPRSRSSSQSDKASSMNAAHHSWISRRPRPMRSMSALIKVTASASETAVVLMRKVFLKISVMRLPRKMVRTRYVLCSYQAYETCRSRAGQLIFEAIRSEEQMLTNRDADVD